MTEAPEATPLETKHQWTGYKWLIALLQLGMAAAAATAAWQGQWLNAVVSVAIIALTVVPTLVARRIQVYVPPEFEALAIVFVFGSLFLGEVRAYYTEFPWWDTFLHTSSGFILGIFGFLLVYVMNQNKDVTVSMKPGFVAFFAFNFAVSMGAIWEIFEYALDETIGSLMQKDLPDTMWDLIVDTAGAAVMCLCGYAYTRRGTEYFVTRWIAKFVDANPRLFRTPPSTGSGPPE